jgi:hypothetical protein
MSIKRITYIGKDKALSKEFEQTCEKYVVGEYKFETIDPNPENLIKHCLNLKQNIVFIDLTLLLNKEVEEILEEVVFLKQQPVLKGTLFGLIFENSRQFHEYEWAVSKGFQLTFTIGQDLITFFMDSYRIAINEDYALPRFAKAEKMNTQVQMSCISTLVAINEKFALVETDVEQEEERSLKASLNAFPVNPKIELEVQAHYKQGLTGIGLDTYLLKLPITQPWDEVREDSLAQETIETWLSNHNDDIIDLESYLYLFNLDSKENMIASYQARVDLQFNFIFESEEISEDDLRESLKLRLPPLVFVQLKENKTTKDEVDFMPIEKIIRCVTAIENYRPIIILGSCPSSSEAIRKIFLYEGLLSHGEKLTWERINELSTKLKEKKGDKFNESNLNYIKTCTPVNQVDVYINSVITSLSEHDITFYAQEGLPMFGVLKIEIPVPAYITIISPVIDLEKKEKYEHYMGIIHGTSEQNTNLLRQIVNKIMHKPIDIFSKETLHALLSKPIQQPEKVPEKDDDTINDKRKNITEVQNHDKMNETYNRVIQHKKTKI